MCVQETYENLCQISCPVMQSMALSSHCREREKVAPTAQPIVHRVHVQTHVQKHAARFGVSPNCNDIDYRSIIRFARYLQMHEREDRGLDDRSHVV